MEKIIPIGISLAVLIAGSVTDLQRREVPDWINYGLLFFALTFSTITSIILKDYTIILSSLFGLGVFYALAALMFYTGQWGGGDSKMLLAMGAMIGLPIYWPIKQLIYNYIQNPPFMIVFGIMILIAGAAYGVIWTTALVFLNFKNFKKDFTVRMQEPLAKKLRIACLIIIIILSVLAFLSDDFLVRMGLIFIAIVLPTTLYLFIAIKSIETVCMIKKTSPLKLVEGDWISEDVIIEGKTIARKKDLGLEKKQIETIIELFKKKKIKYVKVKEGIPFVPSFLIAFILTLLYFYF